MSEGGVQVHEFVAHSTRVNCVAIGPKSTQVIATGGEDWKVNIWRVGTVNNIWSLGHNKAPIECLCFDSDENCVVSGSFNGSVKVYDLNEGKLARNLGTHQTNVTSVQYHPFGEFLVTGSADNTMKFWDVRNKTCVETYTGHKKEITCVRFSPDGKWVASSGKDGQILFYDLIASKHINTIRIPPAYATSFEFNPTEFSLAASTSTRAVRLWDLETMKSTYSTPPESQLVKAVTFSNLGNELFLAAKSSLKIWDIENTFRQMETLEMGWDNMEIGDIKIVNNDQMVAAGFNTNSSFVSIYEIDLSDYIGQGLNQNNEDEEGGIRQSNSQESFENYSEPSSNKNKREPSPSVSGKSNSNQARINTSEKASKDSESQSDYSNNVARRINEDITPVDSPYLAPPKPSGKPPLNSRKEGPPDLKVIPEDGELKGYYDDEKLVPSVEQGEGYTNEMATSMGDSFWRRFKESFNNPQAVDNKKQQENEAIQISNALEQMLPPSGFDDYDQDYLPVNNSKAQAKPTSSSSSAAVRNPPGPILGNIDNSSKANPPALKVLSRRDVKPVQERPTSSNAALYGNVNYSNINDIETKGIEGLAIVGSNRHINPTANNNAVVASNKANYPIENNRDRERDNVDDSPSNDLSKCYDQIERLLNQSDITSSHLSQKLTQLRILRNTWRRGDVFVVIDLLQELLQSMKSSQQGQNLFILSDFFAAMNLQHQHLTLDACVKILPILDDMLLACNQNKSSEQVVFAAYKSLVSLALAFGELIRSTRSSISIGQKGVDLSREARLEKCNICYDVFQKARQRIELMKYQYRNNQEMNEILDQYMKLCQQYF